jgi:predicted RNA-binding protein with PUA-like domain
MAYWLMKSEPDELSYADLMARKRAGWDGVRNHQAKNFLRRMVVGDRAIFYHSSTAPPGAAGICRIAKAAEPDPTQFDPASHYYDATSRRDDPRWDWVTVAPVKRFARYVPLDELRTLPELATCRLLARGNRLSVMPLTDAEFAAIARAGGVSV